VRAFSIQADDAICKSVLQLCFEVGLFARAGNMSILETYWRASNLDILKYLLILYSPDRANRVFDAIDRL